MNTAAQVGAPIRAGVEVARVRPHDPPSTRARAEWRQLGYVLATVLGVRLLPRVLLGQRSHVTIYDNLDSDFLYRVLVAKGQRLFDQHATIPELLGGLPRWDYPSAFKVSSLLFWLLPPFWAYTALETFVSAAGVLGMALLLRDYVPAPRPYRLAIAATFGLLPFYSIYDLSVAGQPIMAWALLNLWHGRRPLASLALCAAFPFASILPTGGAFFMALAGIVTAIAAVRYRRMPWQVLGGGLVLALGYLVADGQFVAGLLQLQQGAFASHRSLWRTRPSNELDALGLLRAVRYTFLEGRYHAASLHTPILLVTCVALGSLVVRQHRIEARTLLTALIAAALLASTAHITSLQGFETLATSVPALRQVTLRFWWSLPLLWYSTLGLVALYWPKVGLPKALLQSVLALQLGWVFVAPTLGSSDAAEPELRLNYEALVAVARGHKPKALSYAEFVAAPAFDQIRKHVGDDSGRFLSIGLHPSIAALNGLSCADGYHDNYPAQYKLRFRRLIASELKLDARNRSLFDSWGSRAYVLLPKKNLRAYDERRPRSTATLRELSLDRDALRDLGVHWILSTFVLEGRAALPFLHYEGRFSEPRAAFPVHLYRVLDVKGLAS